MNNQSDLKYKLVAYHYCEYVEVNSVKDVSIDFLIKVITYLRIVGENAAKNLETKRESLVWWNYSLKLIKDMPDSPSKQKIDKEIRLKIVGMGMFKMPSLATLLGKREEESGTKVEWNVNQLRELTKQFQRNV